MKKYYLALLLCLGFVASGCLDIAERYILRADGQLAIATDITIDPSIFKMISSFQAMGKDGKSGSSNTDDAVSEKDIIDSLLHQIDSGLQKYRAMPGVLSATASDSLAYDGVHLRTFVVLRSYHDLPALPRMTTDTSSQMNSMMPKDTATFIDSGDQVIFQVENLMDSSMVDASATQQAPPEPVVTKKPKKSKSKKKSAVVEDTSDSSAAFGAAFGSMFNGLFSASVTIESPLLIGADTSAAYDPAKHTASWKLDVNPKKPLGERSPTFHAWLRKPQ